MTTTMTTTTTTIDELTAARTYLVCTAQSDMKTAMALAVPFVLDHPAQASVLSELAVVAASADSDAAAFRAAIARLLDSAPAKN